MTTNLTDHELTVLVEAAAEGTTNSRAAAGRGLEWAAMGPMQKNAVREPALPFIYHGTKALAELGYRKPRIITTHEQLAKEWMIVVRTDAGTIANIVDGKAYFFGYEMSVLVATLALPVTVLWELEPKT